MTQRLLRTDGEATRARILQAAGTLMAQSGFAATPSKAIAALAAVDLASINYHFGGREGLLQATLAEAHRHFISEEELRALADSAQPASEKLRALLALLAKNCVNASSWHGRALARELGNPSPQLLQMLQAQVPQKARPVLRILSEVCSTPCTGSLPTVWTRRAGASWSRRCAGTGATAWAGASHWPWPGR